MDLGKPGRNPWSPPARFFTGRGVADPVLPDHAAPLQVGALVARTQQGGAPCVAPQVRCDADARERRHSPSVNPTERGDGHTFAPVANIQPSPVSRVDRGSSAPD